MGAEIERIQETVADRQRGFVPDLRSEVFLLPNETQRRAQRVKMNLESFAKFTELVNDLTKSPQQALPASIYVKQYRERCKNKSSYFTASLSVA